MNRIRMRKMVYSALLLALALVLPFLTGQIPQIGAMLCPMHFPVLLCGFVCGWPWGLAVGFLAPVLRSVIFGMPPMMPTALAMAFELATYGAVSGLLFRLLPDFRGRIYVSLIAAMVAGRLIWGGAQYILMGLKGGTLKEGWFLAGAVTGSVPGIVLQIVLVPALVIVLAKAGLIPGRKAK